jgi:hypothetical protein
MASTQRIVSTVLRMSRIHQFTRSLVNRDELVRSERPLGGTSDDRARA